MKIIGITGGVGAGKTQILEYLNNKYGATICMTDEVGKKLQKKGTECFDEIVAHFGNEILDEKGELDRAKLSDIVFADRVELSVLNGIVHPRVKEEIQKKITREERKNTNLMLIEGALLIEDHYEEICDELWYVYVKVGEELRTIQNVRDLLGEDCIKEEYNKYIKALHALKRVFVFSVEEKEEAFDEVLNDIKDEETKDLARKYVETWKEERRKELEGIEFE